MMDIPMLTQKFHPYILCGENTAVPLMKWADVNPMTVYPMQPGLELNLDAVTIKALFGRHTPLPGTVNERIEAVKSHPVVGGNPLLAELAFWGDFEYRNFLFTTLKGSKILLWGNRLNFPEQRNALRAEKPDVLIMQITRPEAPKETTNLCAALGCKLVILHHVDYPKDYRQHDEGLKEKLALHAPRPAT